MRSGSVTAGRHSSVNNDLGAGHKPGLVGGEAEKVVAAGSISPDAIHLPGIYVHRVVALTPEQAARKSIEKRTVRLPPDSTES
jgi:hypothetical protein